MTHSITQSRMLARAVHPRRTRPGAVKERQVTPSHDSVVLSEQSPSAGWGRGLLKAASYWSRRLALSVAAIPAALFGIGLGASPALLTGAHKLHQQGIDGSGVRVAVLDKGFTRFGAGSEDVVGVARVHDNSFQEGLEKSKSDPIHEIVTRQKGMSFHGNAMAGLITGETFGMKGVAPGAEVVGVSIVDEKGVLETDLFVKGLQWVADNHQKQEIQVVSASVNYRNPSTEQREKAQELVDQLKSKGVAVVVAAGNDGPKEGTVKFPADLENVIAVGATTPGWTSSLKDDRLERYSSRGGNGIPGPSLLAPAGLVFTKDNHGQVELTNGTSNGAPMVAAGWALLSQAYPEASWDQKRDALLRTAAPLGGSREAEGHGLMQLEKAFQELGRG